MQCPKAALFDLDDTLADSFMPPKPEMLALLAKLRKVMPVAILSGASFERMKQEILDPLASVETEYKLFGFPDSASLAYACKNGSWECAYSLEFDTARLEEIKEIIESCAPESTVILDHTYEARILLEKTQVRYAALGVNATEQDKSSWDPDQSKRKALKAVLDEKLPDCAVLIGGRTTIDITRKGVDKSYGVRWLSEHTGIPTSDMFYVGDALYEGGNDQVVVATGIQARETSGPQETLSIVQELLSTCES